MLWHERIKGQKEGILCRKVKRTAEDIKQIVKDENVRFLRLMFY